jgi:hypothetical protein
MRPGCRDHQHLPVCVRRSGRRRALSHSAAIAAAVIGGTSLLGGSGTAIGSLIGALVVATLNNGLVMMGAQATVSDINQVFEVCDHINFLHSGEIVLDALPPRQLRRN